MWHLDNRDIHVIFQPMRGEAVAQRMRAGVFGNLGGLCFFFQEACELPGGWATTVGQSDAAPMPLANSASSERPPRACMSGCPSRTDSHHFVFLIEKVPVRFYQGFAWEPTVRTLWRQEAAVQQLGLALEIDEADGLVFRFAIETGVTGNVERVVFLVLRGDEGYTECAWQGTPVRR